MAQIICPNSFRAWWLAIRPKTLTGAAAPVLVGGALAYADHVSEGVVSFVLCLLFAFLMQIASNLINDYFDYRKGTDREDRLGPERACAQGWITPRAMLIGIGVVIGMACVIGLLLLAQHWQWELLAVGVLCVLFAFLYTTHLSYLGLGDLLVWIFFGVIPVGFTYYVMTQGHWTWPLTWAGLGMGFATDNLLIVNNYRDVEQDRVSHKRTLIVRLGRTWGPYLYVVQGLLATLLAEVVLVMELPFFTSGWVMLPFVYLGVLGWHFRQMQKLTGKALNKLLGQTALNIFLYALLLGSALLLA